MLVSEVRQTDDSDKVSEVGHVGQDVGKTDDELSEIDNEISETEMINQLLWNNLMKIVLYNYLLFHVCYS